MTACGVFRGIQACLKHLYGDGAISGRTIAIQGVGKVGFRLARLLHQAGGKIIISDINSHMVERALTEFSGVIAVEQDDIYDQECDVFAPCALGGSLNAGTVERLKCSIVAGSANNQLASPECARLLADRGILYAVDYVINAGGLINVTDELKPGGYNEARAKRDTEHIYSRVLKILQFANKEDRLTTEITESMVKEILQHAHKLR